MPTLFDPGKIKESDKTPLNNLELKTAIADISSDQREFLKQLKGFLQQVFSKNGFFVDGIDGQNVYLGKREVEIFSKMLKKKSITIDSENIGRILSDVVSEILTDIKKTNSEIGLITTRLEQQFVSICNQLRKTSEKISAEDLAEREKIADAAIKFVVNDKASEKRAKKNVLKISKELLSDTAFKKATVNRFSSLMGRIKNIDRFNAVNFRIFKRSVYKLVDRRLFGAITNFSEFNTKRKSIERALLEWPHRFMRDYRLRASNAIAKFAANLKSWLSVAFGLNIIVPVVKFVRFSINGIVSVVRFGARTVTRALNFVLRILGTIKNVVVKTLSFAVKNLNKALHKIGAVSVFKMTAKMFLGFFSTYVGAYVLGYVAGMIWGNVEKLFDFIKGASGKIKEFVSRAKKYVDDSVFGGVLKDISEWTNSAYSFTKFLAEDIWRIFQDDEMPLEKKLEMIGSLFEVRDKNDKTIELGLSNKIGELAKFINEKLLNGLFWERNFRGLTNFAVRSVASLFGAKVGATIGASIGYALPIPGLNIITGLIGGVVGSFAGGMLGSLIGDTVLKVIRTDIPLGKTISPENRFEQAMRQAGLLAHSYDYGKTSDTEGGELAALSKFASEHLDDSEFDTDSLKRELQDLKIFKGFGEKLSFGDKAKLRKELTLLSNIDEISYEDIVREIDDSVVDLKTLYEKDNNFSIYQKDINDSAYKSSLKFRDLDGDGAVEFRRISIDDPYNPLWLKVGRALRLRELLLQLKANLISPSEFINLYNDLKNPRSAQYDLVKIKTNDPIQKVQSLSYLIHGQAQHDRSGILNRLPGDTTFGGMKFYAPESGSLLFENMFSPEGKFLYSYERLRGIGKALSGAEIGIGAREEIIERAIENSAVLNDIQELKIASDLVEALPIIKTEKFAGKLLRSDKLTYESFASALAAEGVKGFDSASVKKAIDALREKLKTSGDDEWLFLKDLGGLANDFKTHYGKQITKESGFTLIFHNWDTGQYQYSSDNSEKEVSPKDEN